MGRMAWSDLLGWACTRMNGSVPIMVYFVCQHCNLPYRVKKEPRSKQFSGSIDCVECTKAAYEWTGFYDLVDLKLIRMPDSRQWH